MSRRRKTENLGLSAVEEQSYDEFIRDRKPHELHRELAQLRSLLSSYRKAYQAASGETKQVFLEETRDYIVSHLVETKDLSEGRATQVADMVLPGVESAYDAKLSHLGMGSDYLKNVRTLLKDIAVVAEKAKKIKDGLVFNVNIKTDVLTEFLTKVVFANLPDHMTRAKIARSFEDYLGTNNAQQHIVHNDRLPALKGEVV